MIAVLELLGVYVYHKIVHVLEMDNMYVQCAENSQYKQGPVLTHFPTFEFENPARACARRLRRNETANGSPDSRVPMMINNKYRRRSSTRAGNLELLEVDHSELVNCDHDCCTHFHDGRPT